MPPLIRLLPLITLIVIATGCASVNGPADKRDPFEGFNRAMYRFNDGFDRAILKPVAEGYQQVMPRFANDGVSNFFSNLDDFYVLLNDLLQFKFGQANSDLQRIVWNSTVGLLGLIDVATAMDLPKHDEDFGQTLGYWGVGSGPYLVLPFLGPSSVRDGSGLAAKVYLRAHPLYHAEDEATFWGAVALNAVDTRAGLLRASKVLETAALDEYVFLRDAYFQQREHLIHDGNPPGNDFEMFDDELLEPGGEAPAR